MSENSWLREYLASHLGDLKTEIRDLRVSVDRLARVEIPEIKTSIARLSARVSFWKRISHGLGAALMGVLGYIFKIKGGP
jgi:hypothetical protein